MVPDTFNYTDSTFIEADAGILENPLLQAEAAEMRIQARRPDNSDHLIFYLVLFQLLLLVAVRLLDPLSIGWQLRNFARSALTKIGSTEEQLGGSVLLYLNAFISLALLFRLAARILDWRMQFDGLALPIIFGIIALIILIKRQVVLSLAFVVERESLFNKILGINGNGLFVLGMLLLPFNLLLHYIPQPYRLGLLQFICLLIALVYLFNLFRAFREAIRSKGIGVVHIFSYLCASEIFSLLILAKTMQYWLF